MEILRYPYKALAWRPQDGCMLGVSQDEQGDWHDWSGVSTRQGDEGEARERGEIGGNRDLAVSAFILRE